MRRWPGPAVFRAKPTGGASCRRLRFGGPFASPGPAPLQRRPIGRSSGPFAALCAPLLLVATAAALAQDGADIGTDPAPDDSMSEDDAPGLGELLFDRWQGSASLGGSRTGGNSESTSLFGELRLRNDYDRWKHLLRGSLQRTTSTILIEGIGPDGATAELAEDETTADRVLARYQPEYFLTEDLYALGVLGYERAPLSNIDRSLREILGVGYQIVDDDATALSVELGAGNQDIELVSGPSVGGPIAYFGANYLQALGETVEFNADLRAEIGNDNRFVELELGLAASLGESFSVKLSHVARSNTDLGDPADPLESERDDVTTINLVLEL